MSDHRIVEDGVVLAGTRRTKENYLVAQIRCARTGIQDYLGRELGRPDMPRVRVYRPEDEVFSRKSFSTYAHKPLTNDHPPEPLTADNWKKYSVGSLDGDVVRDGERVSVSVMLMDADAIREVEAGKREVSAGYEMDLDWTPGVTDSGEEFDCVARNFKINHVAIVDRGRAGPEFRIGDSDDSTSSEQWGARPITNDGRSKPSITEPVVDGSTTEVERMSTRTIVVDGLQVETTDAGAAAIAKLQDDLTTARAATDAAIAAANDAVAQAKATADAEAEAAKAAHEAALDEARAAADSAVAEKDAALAARDSTIAELEAKVLTDAQIDERVAKRAELTAKAKAFGVDADFTGKSDAEIKTAAVAAARGAEFAADKSEAYIAVAFDMLDVPAASDTVRETLMTRTPAADSRADDRGYSDRVAYLKNAHKTTAKEAI